MPEWLKLTLGIAVVLMALWIALVIALVIALYMHARQTGRTVDWREILRLVPDTARLLKRLITSGETPVLTRWVLGALLVYLVLPIDLIPDLLPVIGWLDDAIVALVAIRFAISRAGYDVVAAQWPGTPTGLRALVLACGVGR